MFQSNKKDQISPVTQQYFVGRRTMTYSQIRGSFWFGLSKRFNSVFEFIWIQYICKFCLVYHLKDLGASR